MKNVMKGLGLSDVHRDKESPVVKANPFSKLTLWWINKHVWQGFKRPLAPHDIHTVPAPDKSVRRALKIGRYWDDLTPEQKSRPNALLKATIKSNWQTLFTSILLILLGEMCKFTQPFLIADIVSFFKGKGVTQIQAYIAAGGMVALTGVYSVLSTHGEYLGQVMAMRMRSSCSAILTRKATRLSSKGLSQISSGQVNNILASDVEKFYNAASEFRGLFVGPIVLVALMILMALELKLYIIPALCFIILFNGIRIIMGNMSAKIRIKWAAWTDKRISRVSEVVSSMTVVKAHCWEGLIDEELKAVRAVEIKKAGHTMFLNGLNLNLGHICDRIVTLLVMVTLILSGVVVDYKTAIQVLVWMKMGQLGFLNFPVGYSMWRQMEASLSRIQDFLMGDELMGTAKMAKEAKVGKGETVHVKLSKASASWSVKKKNESQLEKMMKATLLKSISGMVSMTSDDTFIPSGTFSLRNISFHLESGDHVAIIGKTGSGKTSLLLAILGNLPLGGGSRTVKGKIAYVPQQPWIRADTIRNNILMGEPFYRDRYAEVLRVCALQMDIAGMDGGDLTFVGDGGGTLSGGQRARISLARALYREADIFILDDPSSALDNKVTDHIFSECFKGILKDKMVILATNDCSLLSHSNKIIALTGGRVEASGTLAEVAKKIKVDEFLSEPLENTANDDELADVFEKQDKASMLMPLLGNKHMKKEHAHVPTKRATPFSVYVKYWKAGHGYITLSLFALLLLAQQTFSILAEWWLVKQISSKSKYGETTDDKYGDYNTDYKKDYGNSKDTQSNHYNSTKSHYSTYTTLDPLSIVSHITQGLFTSTTSQPSGLLNDTFSSTLYPPFIVKESNDTEVNLAAAAAYPSPSIEDQVSMLWQYGTFVSISVVLGLISVCVGTTFTACAAKNLYNNMFDKILRAPIDNFNKDKAGEMINRFARDTGRMDDIIPITINSTFLTAAIIISHACYICIIDYYVVVASIPYFILVIIFILYSVRAIRDTKRLESEFRTPSFEHLQHLLSGLEVIRAFGMEGFVIKEADALQDRHTAAWFLYIGSMYWMKMRLNLLVTVYLAAVLVIAFFTTQDAASPVGLSLAYILVFMGRVQYCAMYSAMLDANMTSVEHIGEYDHLEHEERQDTEATTCLILPPAWPENGVIKLSNVNITYPGAQNNILQNLTLDIKSCEKVGIVGRTGAGKSTIFNVMLRFFKYTGTVTLDGINIKALGLDDLRNALSFLPQVAVLHTGTLRRNLDPFNHFPDRHIWLALEKVKLKTKVIQLPGQLDTEIDANGSNFSAGQKQLLFMVRALLNNRKIMLLDEITANVDIETARIMDKVLAECFKDCTILNVSHDLERIINYDRVLVMGGGNVLEFDHPHLLLQDTNGAFYSLVQHCGSQRVRQLRTAAENSYRQMKQNKRQNQTRL